MIKFKMLKQIQIIALLFICFLSFLLTGIAQLPGNSFSVSFLSVQDGLSQGTNRYMLQDSKGYMWLSSYDGINRYNGKEFFHFKESRYYENCSPVKQVWGLVEDDNADVWMGSLQGLYRYQRDRNSFVRYDIFTNKKSNGVINMPFAVVGKDIWVTDGLFSIKAIDIHTQKVKTIFENPANMQPAQPSVSLPQYDGKGNVWVANANNIYKIQLKDQVVSTFPIYKLPIKGAGINAVTGFSLHVSEQVFAVATTKGLVLFDIKKEQQIPLNDNENLITGQEAWYVKADADCFLVANEKCPLIKVSLHGKKITPLIEKKVLDNDLHRGSRTACMYRDKWNRLWINANGEYSAVIDFNERFFKKIVRGTVNGLPSGTVVNIKSIGNDIWVSDTHLTIIEKATGKVKKKFSPADLPRNPLYFDQLMYDSLLKRIWISAGEHIYYYDLKTERFVKTKFDYPVWGVEILRCFTKLKSGELLLVAKEGVWQVDKDCKTGVHIPQFGKGINNDLFVQQNGRLVMSVIGQPLQIIEFNSSKDFRIIHSIDLQGIPMMVSEDTANKVLWVATDLGVYKLDNTTYKILRRYGEADGMANEFIYAVIPDKYGWIWCSTNKGIIAINTKNNEVVNFDMNQNLQELEFNNRAYESDDQGYIYFGGVKGMNYFKPPHTDNDIIQPKIIIEDVLLNNTPVADLLNPDHISKIKFLYGTGTLSIKVDALHLIKAKNLKILYRLRGLDTNWIAIKNGEEIQMFNLAPGNYQLEISYTNGSSNKTHASRVLHIQVMPPWYFTWWFRVLAILSIAGVSWLIVTMWQKRKLKKLKQDNEIMRLTVEKEMSVAKERERIIADLHDDVGATLSSLNIYGDLASKVWNEQPQESRNLMDKITSTSKDLMGRMGDIIWSMKPADEEKYTIEARLKNYANELLSPKNILCTFDIDEELEAGINHPEIRKNILLICKEGINNISKYGGANTCHISFKKEEDFVQLQITDNGNGFDTDTKKQGNGIGNIKQRCRQFGGDCQIISAPGNGTVIKCIFPIAIISHTR